MKRILSYLGVILLTALITFLAVTAHFSNERADRLHKALMDAEARLMDIEEQNNDLRQQLASDRGIRSNPPVNRPPNATLAGTAPPAVGLAKTAENLSARANSPLTVSAALGVPDDALVRYAALASPSNSVLIKGTSSIHNWQVHGKLIGGMAELPAEFPVLPQPELRSNRVPAAVNVLIPVRSLSSIEADGRPYSTAMDDIMYGKLLADRFARITFSLDRLLFKQAGSEPDGVVVYEASGHLAVAGKTNRITMPVSVSVPGSDLLRFTGDVALKMTDFGITPPAPSFAGGAIKTGDDVTIYFSWTVRRSKAVASAR